MYESESHNEHSADSTTFLVLFQVSKVAGIFQDSWDLENIDDWHLLSASDSAEKERALRLSRGSGNENERGERGTTLCDVVPLWNWIHYPRRVHVILPMRLYSSVAAGSFGQVLQVPRRRHKIALSPFWTAEWRSAPSLEKTGKPLSFCWESPCFCMGAADRPTDWAGKELTRPF